MVRKPVVSGKFYEADKDALLKQIEECHKGFNRYPCECYGALAPHAGYIYSGSVAAYTIASIETPETFIILGPNHTGMGCSCAVWSSGKWQTPLGNADIDKELAVKIIKNSELAHKDEEAHRFEHSIEVLVPFIQYFHKGSKIVPICIGSNDLLELKSIGESCALGITKLRRKCVILVSSDMSHYESEKNAMLKDQLAVSALGKFNEELFYGVISDNNISMCGYAPAISMISACKKFKDPEFELIKYSNSGDAAGDYSRVVGYAGILIKNQSEGAEYDTRSSFYNSR
jgi:hypothetical protein